ncbi:uncharacterized protein DS421_15g503750 [Arachis hypogaea]|nr:uncharacterized protein DS421_15g503750 [Arachis hypogaea]
MKPLSLSHDRCHFALSPPFLMSIEATAAVEIARESHFHQTLAITITSARKRKKELVLLELP